MQITTEKIVQCIREQRADILDDWKKQVIIHARILVDAIGLDALKATMADILDQVPATLTDKDPGRSIPTDTIRNLLSSISRELTVSNLSASETALFVFSLKEVLFSRIQSAIPDSEERLEAILLINRIIDQLGLMTVEVYLESRESVIREQQQAFMDVSVPVVRVWDKIILIPLIGMLDSSRTQLMMETMLTALEEYQSRVVLIDISGIPVVDTLVARHLITAASAARLMGAECIITGIRARISQTLVQIGVDLSDFITRASLSDGLELALSKTGQKIQ